MFFEIPDNPTPMQYIYNSVSVPITVTVEMGFRPVPHAHCDWNSVLTSNLSQGWRLVEIVMNKPFCTMVCSRADPYHWGNDTCVWMSHSCMVETAHGMTSGWGKSSFCAFECSLLLLLLLLLFVVVTAVLLLILWRCSAMVVCYACSCNNAVCLGY